jgi:hypothetical protein
MNLFNKLILVGATLSLAGCATFGPAYQPDINDPNVTKINIKQLMRPQVCVNGKWFRLKKDSLGYAVIPTGQRITLKNTFFEEQNQTYQDQFFSCNKSLSFVPNTERTYYANFDIRGTACHIEVFAEDSSRAVGLLAIEIGEPEC